jgi:ATP synthase protein I
LLGEASLFVAVRRILLFQAMTVAAISAVALVLIGLAEAQSVLAGGIAGFLPNLFFAAKFGRHDPKKSAQEVVRAFYVGEALKLVLTGVLFVLIFQIPGISFMPLFIGFVSVIMVFWFALLLRG